TARRHLRGAHVGPACEQALDHPILKLVDPQAVLTASLGPVAVPREAHVVRVPIRVSLGRRPDEPLSAFLADQEPCEQVLGSIRAGTRGVGRRSARVVLGTAAIGLVLLLIAVARA